ncbi:hypothetical protein [Oryzicola mucosus]|uniref:Uncharacterized protein n=1 Tax=Oryzicola mucosus TaxID=2767425 RepID=A0A8J6PUJ2_9HYPH|nr:hypothetical protein [Oryzicola mucosus]MBD0414736.1 hypothetical protein [Oryzicola mucosus]
MAKKTGFFANAFDALVTARQRQATRYVNGVLLTMDDATLKQYGYDRKNLEKNAGFAAYL